MASLPAHPDVVIDTDEAVWTGRFPVHLVRFRHRRFDGAMSGQRTWELWRRGRAAAVLPYDPWRDEVVLIEQFRLPALAAGVDPVMVEVPAGLCDGEEDAEATARREVGEEAGIAVDLMERVGDFVLSAGGSDERCALFAGRVRLGDGALAAGGGLAALFAGAVGGAILHLRGHYFAIASLALAEVLREVVNTAEGLTGGGMGLNLPVPATALEAQAAFFLHAMLAVTPAASASATSRG